MIRVSFQRKKQARTWNIIFPRDIPTTLLCGTFYVTVNNCESKFIFVEKIDKKNTHTHIVKNCVSRTNFSIFYFNLK